MDKHTGSARHEADTPDEIDVDRADAVRRSLDENEDSDSFTFDPRGGEDPGLLELTEDPRERRLKRNTM
jgi:hypothetical protein